MKKLYLVVTQCLLLFHVSAGAQTLLHEQINPNPSYMGGSSVLFGSSSYAVFENLSSLAFDTSAMSVSLGNVAWISRYEPRHFVNASSSLKISEKWRAAAGFGYMLNKPYNKYSHQGESAGQYTPYDFLIRAGTSYRIADFLAAGISVAYANTSLAENQAYHSSAADVYATGRYNGLAVAAGIMDIGFSWKRNDLNWSLPTSAMLSTAYEYSMAAEHKTQIGADMNIYFTGDIAVSCCFMYTYADFISAGLGYRFGGTSILSSSFASNISFRLKNIYLGAAYQLYTDNDFYSGTVSVSVTYQLP